MNYGRILKAVRAELLLTQEELSLKLGISSTTITRIENRHFSPSIFTQKG